MSDQSRQQWLRDFNVTEDDVMYESSSDCEYIYTEEDGERRKIYLPMSVQYGL